MKSYHRSAAPIAPLIIAVGQDASAQEAEIQSLISPNEQSVELGIIGSLDSNRTTGMYLGLEETPALPIASGTYINRDEQSGTWMRAVGTDLGLESRALSLEYERQGQWTYSFDFGQIHKSNPLEISTGLSGTDSNLQTLNGTSRRDLDLSTDRYVGKIGLARRFSKDLNLNVSYNAEYKKGGRHIGVGSANGAGQFLVDPIDQWVHEVDARLDYTGKRLQLTGGFLGSFFENKHRVLASGALSDQIALPPDNQAYNVYLGGGYTFTPVTRGVFKLSYNLMNQTDRFFTSTGGLAGNDRTDLGGEVHNYLGMASVNSRVTNDLSLKAKVRYEGRADRTPVEQYVSGSGDRTGQNVQMDRETVTAEGVANYRLPSNYRLTGAVQYEHWNRSHPPLKQASWRSRTHEYLGRVQLGKQLTETLGGKVAYILSERDGSAFLDSEDAQFPPGLIDPIHWADRGRHQWRMAVDWLPMQKLSLQATVDGSLDAYHSDERRLGPESGTSHNVAIDASYQLTRDWDLTAFVSRNENTRETKQYDDRDIDNFWTADLRNIGYSGGIGVRGRPTGRLKLGADIQYAYDKSEHDLQSTNPNVFDLPDIAYRQLDLTLFADYEWSDNASLKFSYGFTHLDNSDFTYDVSAFTEGTVITLPDRENSHFVGLSVRYQW